MANTQQVEDLIIKTAKKYGVNPYLALAVARQESGFNQKAKSKKGAIGVMQLLPSTAKSLGVDPNSLEGNIEGGIKYLKNALIHYGGDIEKALASYNAGFGAVDDYLHGTNKTGQNPRLRKGANVYDGTGYKETKNYVASIMANFNKAQKDMGDRGLFASNYPETRLEGGISMDGQSTGAAAPITVDYNRNRIIIRDANGNPVEMDYGTLVDMATNKSQGTTPAQYLKSTQAQQISMLDNPKLKEMLNPSNVGFSVDDLNRLTTGQAAALQNVTTGVRNNTQDYYNMLMDAYNRGNDIIMSDPRLQGGSYNLDPRTLALSQDAQATRALLGLGGSVPTAQERAIQAYQNNIANQAGVPYDVLMAAHKDRIVNQLANNTALTGQLQALIKQAQAGDQASITQLQTISNNINKIAEEEIKGRYDLAKNRQTIAGNIITGGVPESITQAGGEQRQYITNTGNLATGEQTGRYGLTGKELEALSGENKQILSNMGALDVANINADASRYSTNVQANTEASKLPIAKTNAIANIINSLGLYTPPEIAGFANSSPDVRNVLFPGLTSDQINNALGVRSLNSGNQTSAPRPTHSDVLYRNYQQRGL